MHPTRKTLAWPLCIALTAALSLSNLAVASPSPEREPGRLHVSASGEVQVAPDKATFRAQLWEQTDYVDAEEENRLSPGAMQSARQTLEERTRGVIQALEGMGIESRRINAGILRVGQVQTYRRLENGQHQQLVATRVERPIEITLHDLEQVPNVLDALTEQGVNQLSDIQYGLQDTEGMRRKALAVAIENARLEAEVLASGLGITLGRVLDVRSGAGGPGPVPPQPMARSMAMETAQATDDAPAAEYRPGETTVEARAAVTWEIEKE